MKYPISVILTVFASLTLAEVRAWAETARYTLHTEAGALAVLDHSIQFGKKGTDFNYVREGGQDVLVAVQRWSLDRAEGRHVVSFLYQPLELNAEVVLRRDLVADGTVFTAGTAIATRYSFPYYRLSWTYDLLEDPLNEVALGIAIQVRNATIEFRSLDGSQLYRSSNIGPVPLLKAQGHVALSEGSYIGFEADGLYAPVSYLNGSDVEVVGAILDASVKAGLPSP